MEYQVMTDIKLAAAFVWKELAKTWVQPVVVEEPQDYYFWLGAEGDAEERVMNAFDSSDKDE
jgi:hypothetical protein